jgi:hypothetical protein
VTPKDLIDWLQQMHYLVVQVNERHKGEGGGEGRS